MVGPRSGAKKPGDDDSWESLAEDLFGIDFKRADDDLADDDLDLDEPEPATAGPVDEPGPDDESDDELEAGFPEEDDLEAGFPEGDDLEAGFPEEQAGFPEEPAPAAASRDSAGSRSDRSSSRGSSAPRKLPESGFSEDRELPPAAKPREKDAESADEGDSFWDALNDWDWSESSKKRRPSPEPTAEERPLRAPEAAEEAAERELRGPRRRRRGRGRGERSGQGEGAERGESSERVNRGPLDEPRPPGERSEIPDARRGGRPSRTDREAAPAPRPGREAPSGRRRTSEPPPRTLEPEPDVADDFGPAVGSDDFGAGLLEPQQRWPGRSRTISEDRPGRPGRTTRRVASDRERDEPETPSRGPASGDADAEFEDEPVGDAAERPRRRRRRRRRRTGEEADLAPKDAAAEEEAGFPEEEEAGFPDEDEEPAPPRRRAEPSGRTESRSTHAEEPSAAPRKAVRVPTWSEAIALLVHKRPKQTTGWTPEPDDGEPERRPGGPQGRRRRRRS